MANTGNTLCTTGGTADRAGASIWTNPGNITADDGADATCVAGASGADYLIARAFGFAIPAGATIDGVFVRIEASEHTSGTESLEAQLQDETQALFGTAKPNTNEGVISGTIKSIYTYGSTSDLWGATLTPDIVNSANFGVRFTYFTAHDIRIDYVQMAIEYTPAGGSSVANMQRYYRNRRVA